MDKLNADQLSRLYSHYRDYWMLHFKDEISPDIGIKEFYMKNKDKYDEPESNYSSFKSA